jgi:hypothetical protein
MRTRIGLCGAICALLLLQLAYLAWHAYGAAGASDRPPYRLLEAQTPKSTRVVLIVLDSWAVRTMKDGRLMPRLFAGRADGASGILWAPRVTGTMQGVLALSTGTLPTIASTFDMFGSNAHAGWTIFDGLMAEGRRVAFHGGPGWSDLFGERATGSFRKTGNGPLYREDDLAAIAHLEAAWQSPQPPALSVLHLSETDAAAHRFGTEGPDYAEVLSFWDATLDALLARLLAPGVTAIITSDHGNDAYGTHGGDGDIYRQVPVLMLGEGIRPTADVVMQATDMPATIALLLGLPVPGEAWGIPATQALKMPAVDEMKILLQAYRHVGQLADRASDAGRHAYERALARLGQQAAAVAEHDEAAAAAVVSAIRAERGALAGLEPIRRFSIAELALTIAVFAAALGLMLLVLQAANSPSSARPRLAAGLALAILLVETIAVLRFTHAADIKALLFASRPAAAAAFAALALPLGVGGWLAWARRMDLLALVRRHPAAAAFLLYLLAIATLIYSPVAMLGLVLVVACVHDRAWRLRSKLALGLALAGFLALALHIGWRITGEDTLPRYGIALGAGLLLWLAFALLDRPWRGEGRQQRQSHLDLAALLLVALLFPFSRLQLGAVDGGVHDALAAAGLVAAATAGLRLGASPLALLGLGSVLLFWLARSDLALFLMLAVHAGVLLFLAARGQPAQQLARSAFVLAGSALMGMSTTEHAATVAAFMLLLSVWSGWHPHRLGVALAACLAALVMVNLRYALFDLFGYVDPPISGYLLKHLDLMSAHLGEGPAGLLRGSLLVLLKAWLAGAMLVAAVYQSPQWRPFAGLVAAAAGAMLLFNIGQMGLRASFSIDAMTPRFDLYAFSLFVHSAIFVLSLLALGSWLLLERLQAAGPGRPGSREGS